MPRPPTHKSQAAQGLAGPARCGASARRGPGIGPLTGVACASSASRAQPMTSLDQFTPGNAGSGLWGWANLQFLRLGSQNPESGL